MERLKSPEEIKTLAEGGRLLAQGVERVLEAARPGVTTDELDAIFQEYAKSVDATPSFLNYKGFPKAICACVNDEVVHAIPGDRALEEGNVFTVDCGLIYHGLYTDMARTVAIGEITDEARNLMETTREALALATKAIRVGNRIGDIGAAVQGLAESRGYSVVRALVGHGVGYAVHEDPAVPNFGEPGSGSELRPGLVIAIEPMINIGGPDVVVDDDGWTVRTADGTLSAHFEDTIAVTEDGPQILTQL